MFWPELPGEFTPEVSGTPGVVVTGSRSLCAVLALPGLLDCTIDLSVAVVELRSLKIM